MTEQTERLALIGPNSSGKTCLTRLLSQNNPDFCFVSIGDAFRLTGTILQEKGLMPNEVDTAAVEDVLATIEDKLVNGLVLFHNGQEHQSHTFLNGNTATSYAINPVVHRSVLGKIDTVVRKYKDDYYVGTEGREPSPSGPTFYITGDHQTVRKDIKKRECPDAAKESDETIINAIRKRDIADFRYNNFRIPESCYVLKRYDGSIEEQQAHADFISGEVRALTDHRIELPRGQEVFIYSPQDGEVVYSHTLYQRTG